MSVSAFDSELSVSGESGLGHAGGRLVVLRADVYRLGRRRRRGRNLGCRGYGKRRRGGLGCRKHRSALVDCRGDGLCKVSRRRGCFGRCGLFRSMCADGRRYGILFVLVIGEIRNIMRYMRKRQENTVSSGSTGAEPAGAAWAGAATAAAGASVIVADLFSSSIIDGSPS